jgi:hypothetical protein
MAFLHDVGLSSWAVTCCSISLFHVSWGRFFRSHVVMSSPGVLFRASEVFLRLPLYIAWLRIVAHAFLIMLASLPVSLLLVMFATWAVRTVDIERMPAFFFKMRLPTARYALRTLRRFLFWSISSFRSTCFREVTMPCDAYYTAAP